MGSKVSDICSEMCEAKTKSQTRNECLRYFAITQPQASKIIKQSEPLLHIAQTMLDAQQPLCSLHVYESWIHKVFTSCLAGVSASQI